MDTTLSTQTKFKERYLGFLQSELKLSNQEAQTLIQNTISLIRRDSVPYLFQLPGQLVFQAVSAVESPYKPRKYCKLINITLTLFSEDDIAYRQKHGKNGVPKLRQRQIIRMANEAASQGTLLSIDDFALRIFNCGARTISRDVKELQSQGIHIPLRSYSLNQ
ncbi:MAG: DUF1670 domain-containing protein [Chloroflexota bacterium]